MLYPSPKNLIEIASIFSKNNFKLYLVGGAVRDYILKKENHDYDLTSPALPEEVKRMFRHTIDTGIKHGTVTILYKNESYEVTTFRTESDYSDSRHPDKVEFIRSLDEDLKRRDFTINALAVDISTGEIIDKNSGLSDLEKKTIRAIGDAKERFKEDALRMLRACRFSSKLGFTIEDKTKKAILLLHENIKKVSIERVKEELDKTLLSSYPSKGLRFAEETMLINEIIPSLTLSDSIYEALDTSEEKKLPISARYALLFSSLDNNEVRRILKVFKSSNKETKEVLLIHSSLFYDITPNMSDKEIRLFIKKYGPALLSPIFEANKILRNNNKELLKVEKKILDEVNRRPPLFISDLAINGEDLAPFIKKGPLMGACLNYLLDCVIEKPEINNKENLLDLTKEWLNHEI